MGNRRKEIAIFIAVLVIFALVVFVTRLIGSRKPYDADDVVLNFSDSESVSDTDVDQSSDETIEMGDFTNPYIGNLELDEMDGINKEDEYEGYVGGAGDDVADENTEEGLYPSNPALTPEEEEALLGRPVDPEGFGEEAGGDIPDEEADAGDGSSDITMTELYANMMAYYVCGLEDTESFTRYLTPEMQADFGKHTDEEPYKSLNGNISFSNINMDGNRFSFVAESGTKYEFVVTFDGELVSSVRFAQ